MPSYAMSSDHAVYMTDRKYNAYVCQARVNTYVINLCVSYYVSQGTEISVVSEKTCKEVLQMSR